MPLLFAITLFLSASLLFMVQPMVGKMVLPLLGGSPAVWNACMVFFQALLLLGYLYAHMVSTRLTPKKQWIVHMAVLAVPISLMAFSAVVSERHSPIAIAESLAPGGDTSPFLSVMAILTVAIGVPFFVSSTSAPLLQKWFAYTGHPSARDPYFLYAASNAGSLIFLLGYPLVIEPNLNIVPQAWVWSVGFTILAMLIFFCGRAALNPLIVPPAITKQPSRTTRSTTTSEPPPTGWRKAKWVMLAFVPSSLMLGVTFHMTTDIASIPLLWVGPLALYLLTFIIAFSTIVPPWFRLVIGNLAPVMILLLVFVLISGKVGNGVSVAMELSLHLATFFAAAMMCHYELARDRPSPEHLTGYFLLMSVGGVLGGIFNALVAPMIFPQDYEYMIALVVACLMVPVLSPLPSTQQVRGEYSSGAIRLNPLTYFRSLNRKEQIALGLDLFIPVLCGFAFYGLLIISHRNWFVSMCVSVATHISIVEARTVAMLFRFAVPVMICFFFVDRPLRFALCVATLLGVSHVYEKNTDIIYSERSFFGILKVERDIDGQRPAWKDSEGNSVVSGKIEYFRLVHGTTLHGTQIRKLHNNAFDYFQMFPTSLSPWDAIGIGGALEAFDARQEPLTYYHRTGPVGAMFHELRTRKNGADAKADVAMVGLGTGSVSCYALPGQRLTFYEIDPAVKKLVADRDDYFTYVKDAKDRGAIVDFRMGDARLKLKDDADRKYALLLVDAFSSDSIPVHLLTREAVQMYVERMTDDGILALHISNKFVALEPVVAAIAADLQLEARVWNDHAESRPGKTASSWVVLARTKAHLGNLAAEHHEQVNAFIDHASPLVELYRKYLATLAELEAKVKATTDEKATAEASLAKAMTNKYEKAWYFALAASGSIPLADAMHFSEIAKWKQEVELRNQKVVSAQKELEDHRKSTLMDALRLNYGQQIDHVIDLMKRHRTSKRLKSMLKEEESAQLVLLQKLKDAHGGDLLLRTAINKRLVEKPEELEPVVKSLGETTTVQQAWEKLGGLRIELLRRWVNKYAAGEQEPADVKTENGEGGEMPRGGSTLAEAVFGDYGLRFFELAGSLDARTHPDISIKQALLQKHRELFRPLNLLPDVPTWTDDYSDVLRVMMIPEVQKLRGYFGLPNKLE